MPFDRVLMKNCKNKPSCTIFIIQRFNHNNNIVIPPIAVFPSKIPYGNRVIILSVSALVFSKMIF